MKTIKKHVVLFVAATLFLLYVPADVFSMENTGMGADTIASGAEFTGWLEAHSVTGGTAVLTADVIVDEVISLSISPDAPKLTVDTNGHTVTVTGDAEIFCSGNLVFCGKPQKNGFLHVVKGGLLSLSGVTVAAQDQKTGGYALVQEEGGALVLKNCSVSGNIHYAQTPVVLYDNAITVLVEKEQDAPDVLPTSLECSVNRSGEVMQEEVPVTWQLAGTKKQQKKRLRFCVNGKFEGAAALTTPVCTVAYNDFPLTFTDVDASVTNNGYYIIQGSFTKPQKRLPIIVAKEYSFNNKRWTVEDKNKISHVSDGFSLILEPEQWDTSVHPCVYIRLSWNDNGKEYFSNVLKVAADSLDIIEDQGGTRGGGTSIVNRPEKPEIEDDNPGTTGSGDGSQDTKNPKGDSTAAENAAISQSPVWTRPGIFDIVASLGRTPVQAGDRTDSLPPPADDEEQDTEAVQGKTMASAMSLSGADEVKADGTTQTDGPEEVTESVLDSGNPEVFVAKAASVGVLQADSPEDTGLSGEFQTGNKDVHTADVGIMLVIAGAVMVFCTKSRRAYHGTKR